MANVEDGMTAQVLRTKDGGETSEDLFQTTASAGVTLMGLKMLSVNEAWAAGGTVEPGDGGSVVYYFRTVDGGDSWEPSKVEKAIAFDLSFADGIGYSASFTETGSGYAVYK
jgi:hypothetical protein